MFFVLSQMWNKEKILSPYEESNLRHSDTTLQCSTAELQRLNGERVYYKVLKIHVLHTARISNVGSVMFVNKIREMVSFELGKEIGKDVFFFFFSLFHTREKTKNIFLYLFTKLKPYYISYSIFKHDKLSTLLILAVCRTHVI